MSDSQFPEIPEIEQAYRAAHRALEAIMPESFSFVPEDDLDGTDVILQFPVLVDEAALAVAAHVGPYIGWRVEQHGHPIRPYVACATCGEPVREGDLEFISTVPDWDITGPQRPAEAPGEESSATTPRPRRPAHQSGTNHGRTEKP